MTTRYLLAAGRPVLLRPDGTVQLGWDPRRAVQVAPPPGMAQALLATLLRQLQSGATPDELCCTAAAFDDTAAPVVDRLIEALLADQLISAQRTQPVRSASIRIHGRGPLSQLLADGLRCSGARVRHTTQPHAVISAGTDLVVIADYQVADPWLLRDLHHGGIAHLPVRVRDGAGLIGPLVLPGVTSCLQCADLHRTDRDAAWPAVAAQLRGAVGSASRATILATAAVAMRQVELVMRAVGRPGSAHPPPTLDTTLELDADGSAMVARRWSKHPACPC